MNSEVSYQVINSAVYQSYNDKFVVKGHVNQHLDVHSYEHRLSQKNMQENIMKVLIVYPLNGER